MSDNPINADPTVANQPPVAAGAQPDPLAGLQSAIDAAAQTPVASRDEFKQVFGEAAGETGLSAQSEGDPEKVFVQTVKDAVKKLEEDQAKQ